MQTAERVNPDSKPAEAFSRRLAIYLASSVPLTLLTVAFGEADLGALVCVGIAVLSAIPLIARVFAKRAKQRYAALLVFAGYVGVSMLLLTHYALVRDHVRWVLQSSAYKRRVLAQPNPVNGEFKHAE